MDRTKAYRQELKKKDPILYTIKQMEYGAKKRSLKFGLDFNIMQTSLITFTSFVIGAISFIPGGIGLTEASLIGLLLLFEVEPSLASTLAIFIRLTTIWFATIVGFIGVRFLFLRSKNN